MEILSPFHPTSRRHHQTIHTIHPRFPIPSQSSKPPSAGSLTGPHPFALKPINRCRHPGLKHHHTADVCQQPVTSPIHFKPVTRARAYLYVRMAPCSSQNCQPVPACITSPIPSFHPLPADTRSQPAAIAVQSSLSRHSSSPLRATRTENPPAGNPHLLSPSLPNPPPSDSPPVPIPPGLTPHPQKWLPARPQQPPAPSTASRPSSRPLSSPTSSPPSTTSTPPSPTSRPGRGFPPQHSSPPPSQSSSHSPRCGPTGSDPPSPPGRP